MSNGDYDNIGHVREKEMEKVAKYMRFKDLRVVKNEYLDDGPWNWSADLISDQIGDYIKYLESKRNAKVDLIVTFDDRGVSGHQNHISCYWGVRHALLTGVTKARAYALHTVNNVQQYISFADILVS